MQTLGKYKKATATNINHNYLSKAVSEKKVLQIANYNIQNAWKQY